jgi:hypothetical protein
MSRIVISKAKGYNFFDGLRDTVAAIKRFLSAWT